ncbi:hypothetical protein Sjap_025330 [Stephania japonica]|uniref:non-specific serine/threonine protein kinase n=1 Tax=Stephania japonica TaxID=461633 RepID=A0AAP0E1H8_9MAGN
MVNAKAPSQTTSPNAPSQIIAPSVPSQTTSPNASSQTTAPSASSQTTAPSASSQTTAPSASSNTAVPDPDKHGVLDWETRLKIIKGIAEGLLHLHESSQDNAIHRDLKPSNILLDENLNPKIADFGLARLLDGDQTHGNTRRRAETVGYMAPEYALHGNYSKKSDIYAYGAVVLEIVTGVNKLSFDKAQISRNTS